MQRLVQAGANATAKDNDGDGVEEYARIGCQQRKRGMPLDADDEEFIQALSKTLAEGKTVPMT